MVVDELARRWKAPGWREKFGGEIALTNDIVVLRPQEYMNVSGQAVQRTQAFYKIEPKETIVVHDEIDLPFGKIRVKVGGGHGGHNGLRPIIQMTGYAFVRVRCGLGKPVGGNEKVTGPVLGGFSKAEQTELPSLIGGAADAVPSGLYKAPIAAVH